ncbi:hypothetical protein DTY78_07275 [Escherichia coli]|nr:hypothetical protein [Escherichia coli]
MRGNRLRLHGLDLSTKHVADDYREPQIKKPRTMARLGIHSCHTQQRQHIRFILLICSLKSKRVMRIFCNFPHIFAIVKRILQRLVQTEQ